MREATLDDERSSPVGAALEVFRRRSSQRCRVSRSHSSRRQLKHVFKIVIAGNHECTFDDRFMKATGKDLSEKEFAIKQTLSDSFSVHEVKNAKQNLKNCIYLEDSSVELFGLQIYGTPWLVITLK
ncbi:unnamed protein product [Gongylonema pulchrum]|uniref:Metallophos domain-containing protein n=1 Tax=Gongylonema pulchrum TaxID=637853 RepID=A0A183EV32_9BILA|nr:unnamed protein product [Gongylonema pulchrum]